MTKRIRNREARGTRTCTMGGCRRAVYCDGLDVCSRHVKDALGITYRMLDHWVRAGYLRPVHPGGSGNSRSWPPAELEIARRMGVLTEAGLIPAVAAEFARSAWPGGEIAKGMRLEVSAA